MGVKITQCTFNTNASVEVGGGGSTSCYDSVKYVLRSCRAEVANPPIAINWSIFETLPVSPEK